MTSVGRGQFHLPGAAKRPVADGASHYTTPTIAAAVVAAAHSETLRRAGVGRNRIFGVPSFVYAGKLYWGQDRMHFVRGAVRRKSRP